MSDMPNKPEHWSVGTVSRLKPIDDERVARLVFRVGGHAVAHEPERVGELIRHPAIHRVPNAPGVLAGLLNSRGRVVPVYDIRHLLPGTDSGPADTSTIEWVLVFHDHGRDDGEGVEDCVGLIIDEMPLRLRLAPMRDVAVDELAEFFRPWCRRVHEREQVLYGELDMIGMLESIRADAGAEGHGPQDRAVRERIPASPDDTKSGPAAEGIAASSMDAGGPHGTDGDGRND